MKLASTSFTYIVYVEEEGIVDVLRWFSVRDPVELIYKQHSQITDKLAKICFGI